MEHHNHQDMHAGASSEGAHKKDKTHDHHDHHQMMINDFKKRFWASSILTIPILLLSPMVQRWLGVNWGFQGDSWVLFALSSIVYFYGGWPFLSGIVEELKKRKQSE